MTRRFRLILIFAVALALPAPVLAQTEVWTNNASSTLATGIDTDDTAIVVATGHGSRFPSPTGGQFFYLTLEQSGVIEIVKCSARTSDTMTCNERGIDTTPHAFTSGATVQQRLTKATLESFRDLMLPGVTAAGRAILDDADTAAQRTTLGLVIGTNVQAWDADLDTWAGKTAPSGAVVGTSDSQTLTNKTLTTPVISTISNTGTVTLFSASDTVVGRATTDTLTNKTLSTSNSVSAALSWSDGVRQTFNPDGTNAGLNVGANAGEPSSPTNGDVFYDSSGNALKARINGAWVSLGAGGGGGGSPCGSAGEIQYEDGGALGCDSSFVFDPSTGVHADRFIPPLVGDRTFAYTSRLEAYGSGVAAIEADYGVVMEFAVPGVGPGNSSTMGNGSKDGQGGKFGVWGYNYSDGWPRGGFAGTPNIGTEYSGASAPTWIISNNRPGSYDPDAGTYSTGETPGTLALVAADGTIYYLWVDNNGKLRIKASTGGTNADGPPTNDGTTVPNNAGTVVGSQS